MRAPLVVCTAPPPPAARPQAPGAVEDEAGEEEGGRPRGARRSRQAPAEEEEEEEAGPSRRSGEKRKRKVLEEEEGEEEEEEEGGEAAAPQARGPRTANKGKTAPTPALAPATQATQRGGGGSAGKKGAAPAYRPEKLVRTDANAQPLTVSPRSSHFFSFFEYANRLCTACLFFLLSFKDAQTNSFRIRDPLPPLSSTRPSQRFFDAVPRPTPGPRGPAALTTDAAPAADPEDHMQPFQDAREGNHEALDLTEPRAEDPRAIAAAAPRRAPRRDVPAAPAPGPAQNPDPLGLDVFMGMIRETETEAERGGAGAGAGASAQLAAARARGRERRRPKISTQLASVQTLLADVEAAADPALCEMMRYGIGAFYLTAPSRLNAMLSSRVTFSLTFFSRLDVRCCDPWRRDLTYVGMADATLAVVQHKTALLLLDLATLTKDMFYQQASQLNQTPSPFFFPLSSVTDDLQAAA